MNGRGPNSSLVDGVNTLFIDGFVEQGRLTKEVAREPHWLGVTLVTQEDMRGSRGQVYCLVYPPDTFTELLECAYVPLIFCQSSVRPTRPA